MQFYTESLTEFKRLPTKEVRIGDLLLGNDNPIRVQTMTTTDTMNTMATVEQSIRCIEAGAELIRITAPSKNEAENLLHIKNELCRRGYHTPLVADIHFTPNAAEIAARIVEKVRVNPGNYVDKKKFELIEYSDQDYAEEIERIRDRFTPLVKICKEYGTAMRIGTNHGSLSDRIMSRYGDTPMGMVESAMEFLRIARGENYHEIVLSMKSSNPKVMVQAYRLLVKTMHDEWGEIYPLHLGVTEAGDGEDGRIKSAIGIGTLLEDGLGDTIRVSLTEDPEFEIPVCKDILKRYCPSPTAIHSMQDGAKAPSRWEGGEEHDIESTLQIILTELNNQTEISSVEHLSSPTGGQGARRESFSVDLIGGNHVPAVIADLSKIEKIRVEDLKEIGYHYNVSLDKWTISDTAPDYIFTGVQLLPFSLPGTLKVICYSEIFSKSNYAVIDTGKYFPIFSAEEFVSSKYKHPVLNFVMLDCDSNSDKELLAQFANEPAVVLCLSSTKKNAMQSVRSMFMTLMEKEIKNPVILITDSAWNTAEEHLVHYAIETGALLLDGLGDGICLGMNSEAYINFDTNLFVQPFASPESRGRVGAETFINNVAFGILQATRTRISKTEYISCPSCGRTLFDLQETTAKIRAVTHHLKGVKIAIMGCIVNGPGEMADADFGYVGSGPGKITLYKGKEVIKRNVPSGIAVVELVNLLKENGAWVEKELLVGS
jgi:(E)-4-hydroxy-3-methylbut-2-enyl-diphosphate synthase